MTLILGLALGALLMWVLQLPQEPGHQWYDTFFKYMPDWFVALFTAALTASTALLWCSTADLVREARDSSRRLLKAESPYATGGGDFDGKTGFRLDVENHGKTPAFRLRTIFNLRRWQSCRRTSGRERRLGVFAKRIATSMASHREVHVRRSLRRSR
jgi:hypothetical protein